MHLLSKDPNNTEDPLAYRVLLILPTIYRRWGSARLIHLKPCVQSWQIDGMFAGVEGFGADDSWFETAIQLEHNRTHNAHTLEPPLTSLNVLISYVDLYCNTWHSPPASHLIS